jgi:hypothetical protein
MLFLRDCLLCSLPVKLKELMNSANEEERLHVEEEKAMRMEDEMVCRKVEGVKRKRRLPGDQMHGK